MEDCLIYNLLHWIEFVIIAFLLQMNQNQNESVKKFYILLTEKMIQINDNLKSTGNKISQDQIFLLNFIYFLLDFTILDSLN